MKHFADKRSLRRLAVAVAIGFSVSSLTRAAVIEPGGSKPDLSSAQVVTRVVGQVDTHFITSREVRIDDAIDQALDASPVEYQDALKSPEKAPLKAAKPAIKAKTGAKAAATAGAKDKRSESTADGGKKSKLDSNSKSADESANTNANESGSDDSSEESPKAAAGSSDAAKLLLKRSAKSGGVSGFSGKLLTGDEKTFPNNVSKSLDEWMISLEAESLSANPPQATDVAAAVKRVSDYWGNRAAWRSLEVSAEELRTMIERKLLARNFEDFKNNVATAPVSDTDALSYYQRNHARFGNLPFATFKENIKSFLTRQQMEVRMNEWLEVLRRKYKVRNFIAG